jgi:hypothetical protein
MGVQKLDWAAYKQNYDLKVEQELQ